MKKLINDTNGESPLEVGFVLMVTIIVMALLSLVVGTFTDKFMAVMEEVRVNMPLTTAWGIDMWNRLPIAYAKWIWAVPTAFILLTVVWAYKTVVKRSGSTKQDMQYIGTDEY